MYSLRSSIEAHNWCHFLVEAQEIHQRKLLAITIWQKQWQIYLLLGNLIKNGWNNLHLHSKYFKSTFKSNSYLIVNFLSWPSISVNPHFSQYQSYKNNDKFTCCLKNHWKMVPIISIPSLIPLILYHFLIRHHFPLVAK